MKPAASRRPSGQARQSQVLTTFGPGALLDLPEHAALVGGLEHWEGVHQEIVEPRLCAKLGEVLGMPAVQLFAPPVDPDERDPRRTGITVWRFPGWFLSQEAVPAPGGARARRLVPRIALDKDRFLDEDRRRQRVLPIRFVRACPRGHIGDIDWPAYVHRGKPTCAQALWLDERGTAGDFAELSARCGCGASRPLAEALTIEARPLGGCDGARPWLGQVPRESCPEPSRLLLRHASNAWFAQVLSVISLPDPKEALRQAVDLVWTDYLQHAPDLPAVAGLRAMMPRVREALAPYSDLDVLGEIDARRRGGSPAVHIKLAEAEVLLGPGETIGSDDPEASFHAERLPRAGWGEGVPEGLERVLLVHRLREVTAQLGFTRFEASSPDKDGELELGVRRAALAREATWLPAVENRGEGFFLGFAREAIASWLVRPPVAARGAQLEAGFRAWASEHAGRNRRFPGLAFVFLHSLAHLLITEVSLTCGYPAAAIRERIYANEAGHGILLFTASPDAEGTLGGLIEVGRDFARHLGAALADRARLCSNDPVCAQHDPVSPHERRFLLGAACHGCLLIAEPSCEQHNDFLDRALVVPTVDSAGAEFFRLD